MEKSRTTLRDVAKYAGVSVGSVSRYLNNHPSLSGKARAAIETAISKLNYTPNQMAQKLAKGVSGNILLYIYQALPSFNTTWLFELPIIHGVYDYLQGTSYALQIALGSITNANRFRQEIFRQIGSRQVDGIMVLSSWPAEKNALVRMMDTNFPFSLIANTNPLDDVNAIVFDNERAVVGLVDHLFKLGHRNIGFLGGIESQLHSRERFEGFKRALAERGLKQRPEWIRHGDFSYESGVALTGEILSGRPPTAIIAGNDYLAAGAIRAIKGAKLRVPEDISVTGFDDMPVARIVSPELTTVKVPLFEMGHRAAEKLAEGIKHKEHTFSSETMDCELVIRDSTARVRRR